MGFGTWRQTTVAKVEAVPTDANPAPNPRPLSLPEATALTHIFGQRDLAWLLGHELEAALQISALDRAQEAFAHLIKTAKGSFAKALPPELADLASAAFEAALQSGDGTEGVAQKEAELRRDIARLGREPDNLKAPLQHLADQLASALMADATDTEAAEDE